MYLWPMRFLYSIAVFFIRGLLTMIPLSGKVKQFVQGRKQIWDTIANVPKNKKVIWMHCASLGEYEQGLPILQELKKVKSDHFFVVTFFSSSGYRVPKTHLIADLTTYLPWDSKADVKRFIQKLKPSIVLFIRYEFWPNLLTMLHKKNIPTYLIAGLFQSQQLFFKPWGRSFRKLLNGFEHIFVQNESSQHLLHSIGVHQTSVSGDTRFDRVQLPSNSMPFMERFCHNRHCVVAGSTWTADEEVLIDVIHNSPDEWCWLIAPHEINENKIVSLMEKLPKNSQRYSTHNENTFSNTSVLVLDTVGLLSSCYQYAQIAYVGGGMGTKGLHNILEPAAAGIPIVIGKNYASFPEAVQLVNIGGIISISNAPEAKEKLLSLIHDRNQRQETGEINLHFIRASQGATTKIMDTLL
jgi:3-deoxy-D-manno-octulosonic-acid transferase